MPVATYIDSITFDKPAYAPGDTIVMTVTIGYADTPTAVEINGRVILDDETAVGFTASIPLATGPGANQGINRGRITNGGGISWRTSRVEGRTVTFEGVIP